MEVVITDGAREYVTARGGEVFVKVRVRSCCSGALVLLDATTDEPADAASYATFEGAGVLVRYRSHPRGVPPQLLIELRGRRRPRLVAYKNGCALPT